MGVIIAVLAILFIWGWISDGSASSKREKQRLDERMRARRQAEIERENQRKAAENQRNIQRVLDELSNETVEVVYAGFDKATGQPKATIKRKDGTYADVQRPIGGTPFRTATLTLKKEKTSTFTWYSESQYLQKRTTPEPDKQLGESKWAKLQAKFAKIDSFDVDYLYHMTHKDNIPNILSKGLLSHTEARNNQFIKVDIADSQVNDRRAKIEHVYKRSIHDYVPLYFNPKNPMLFRRINIEKDIVIIAIKKSVLAADEILFTDGNAAANATNFYDNLDNLSQLNWDCIRSEYWNDFEDGKRQRCAEVLTHKRIDLSNFEKIICNNLSTKVQVDKTASKYNIKTEVKSSFYFNISRSTGSGYDSNETYVL